MKTSDLTGALLDFWVAKAEGFQFPDLQPDEIVGTVYLTSPPPFNDRMTFAPSTNWAQGGLIIEREQISLVRQTVDWCADMRGVECQFASNPLLAAMRAYVVSKFGDWVADAGEVKKSSVSIEQRIRDALEAMEIPGAQNYSAGDLVEISNLVRGITAGEANEL